jgi:CDP-glucose 4,6-dehydratase
MAKRVTVLDKMEPVVVASTFRDKSVLVTGASGFIGAALVEDLRFLGARVYVFSQTVDLRRPLYGYPSVGTKISNPIGQPLALDVERIIHGDLRSQTDCFHAVSVAEPEFVFHLGAMTQVTEASKTPIEAFRVNALGTMHMLEACRQIMGISANVVVASSDKAYGEPVPSDLPFTELTELQPVHPYDLSKAAADMIARSFGEYYGLKVQVTRLANVYGPGDTNFKRLIPGVLRWINEHSTPVIRSDGKQVRQYLYVQDAVFAYLLLAEKMATNHSLINAQAWNFGPEDRYSVMEVVEQITEIMRGIGYRVREPKVLGEAKDETDELYLDSRQAKGELGWQAQTDMTEGLIRTNDFIRRYLRVEAR